MDHAGDGIGLAVGHTIDAKLDELLPVIKTLYEKNIVALGINGDFQEVKKYFAKPETYSRKLSIFSIFELYDDILKNWKGYNEDIEKTVKKANLPDSEKSEKVGRNDPCPCGSGKKYKKCCMRII